LRTPVGLGKHVRLEYIDVALGLADVNVSGFVGCMSKRKCWRMDPKRPRPRKKDLVLVKDVADDCVTNGGDACCWVVLLSCPSFFFSYFCRCESAKVNR
jgi:hypothetical protein